MSYNVNYVSKIDNVELKDSNGSSITGTDASMSNYEDVFTLITQDKANYNGSTLSDTNCATCVVACACNVAKNVSIYLRVYELSYLVYDNSYTKYR